MEVELREEGDVGDHGENQERVIVKGEVVFVGESDGVEPSLLNDRKGSIDCQELPRHPHRVQHDKEGVSGPFDEVG